MRQYKCAEWKPSSQYFQAKVDSVVPSCSPSSVIQRSVASSWSIVIVSRDLVQSISKLHLPLEAGGTL